MILRRQLHQRGCVCCASSEARKTTERFEDLNISEESKATISQTFKTGTMTQLQTATLPTILTGVDCLVRAKPFTMMGKSLTIALSAVEAAAELRKSESTNKQNDICCLILTPTRESTMHISKDARKLATSRNLVVKPAIGGRRLSPERKQMMKMNIQLLIANLERLLALLRGDSTGLSTRLQNLQLLCIDQADKMFPGQRDQLLPYLESSHGKRQTLVFTENLDESVKGFAQAIMRKDYQCIDIVKDDEEHVRSHIQHELRGVRANRLIGTLDTMLSNEIQRNDTAKTLIFLENTQLTQFMSKVLRIGLKKTQTAFTVLRSGLMKDEDQTDVEVVSLHSKMDLAERNISVDEFQRATNSAVLFCTFEAAAAIDFQLQPSLIVHVGLVDRDEYINRLLWSIRGGRSDVFSPKSVLLLDYFEIEYMKKELADMKMVKTDDSEPSDIKAVTELDAIQAQLLEGNELRSSAELAYRNWLRYYSERMDSLGLSKADLSARARRFAEEVLGLPGPPPINRKIVDELGLKRVPGIIVGSGIKRSKPDHDHAGSDDDDDDDDDW